MRLKDGMMATVAARASTVLPYRDTRGMAGSSSYRMPRKLKKQWRKQIEANLKTMGIPRWVKVKLWWKPLWGWTLKTVSRRSHD